MLRPLRVPACFLLALLFLAPSLRADVRETPGVVKVMSYNMENFFDVFDDPYTADEGTPPKMRDQIKLLAETIRKADPDVLAVVEVENEHVLRAMVREFLSDMGYQYIDVDQSNLSRLDLLINSGSLLAAFASTLNVVNLQLVNRTRPPSPQRLLNIAGHSRRPPGLRKPGVAKR